MHGGLRFSHMYTVCIRTTLWYVHTFIRIYVANFNNELANVYTYSTSVAVLKHAVWYLLLWHVMGNNSCMYNIYACIRTYIHTCMYVAAN